MIANYTIGVDLGQIYDYSALAVVERLEDPNPRRLWRLTTLDHHHVLFLRRWEKGTPYAHVVRETGEIIRRANLSLAPIVFDATGVGREVGDLFYQAHRLGRLGRYWPRGLFITAGRDVTEESVPKRELVGKMQTLLQDGRLKVADALPLASALRRELQNFQVKTTPNGDETFGSAREADHDDIVLAVALACWFRHTLTPARRVPPEEPMNAAS